jgi:LPS-assembly lipoprotein
MARSRRALLAGIALLPVAALGASCGFVPLHDGRADPPPGAAGTTGPLAIAVDPVPGAAGFVLRERLTGRIGTPAVPTHRLAVTLDLREQGAAITQDNVTTRFVLLGSASFALRPAEGGEPVARETVTARTAYSAPASDVGTIFAARAAALDAEERLARALADRIAMRLALLGAAAAASG